MDEKVTIEELKKKVQLYCEERDWTQFHNPKDLSIGIVTEGAELLDHFRYLNDAQMAAIFADPVKKEAVSDELADTLYCVLRFAQMNDIDLSSALNHKMAKSALKYPVEKSKGRNNIRI